MSHSSPLMRPDLPRPGGKSAVPPPPLRSPVVVPPPPVIAPPVIQTSMTPGTQPQGGSHAATGMVLPAEVLTPIELVGELQTVRRPSWPVRIWRAIGAAWEWMIGGATVVLGLALLAPIPIVQFLSLGYLLEVSGRIARTRKFTAGFVGFRKAARVGTIVLGTVVFLFLLRLVVSQAFDARLIDPTSPQARSWSLAVMIVSGLVSAHLVSAYWRGGKLRHFLLPANPLRIFRRLRQGGALTEARDGVWNFVVGLRLPYYFWLGARGFAGGLIWLLLPVTLLAFGGKPPLGGGLGVVIGYVGAFMLMAVLVYLPFLQTRFAAENRWGAMFEVRGVRDVFRRAPIAFWIALLAVLAFSLPLYLLKIEIVPRDAAGLPSLLFVAFMVPARFLSGWAYSRGLKREKPRFWLFRILARLGMLPIVAFYVLIVFFTQYLSWHGVWSLYEQHAFLLPVPFVGL